MLPCFLSWLFHPFRTARIWITRKKGQLQIWKPLNSRWWDGVSRWVPLGQVLQQCPGSRMGSSQSMSGQSCLIFLQLTFPNTLPRRLFCCQRQTRETDTSVAHQISLEKHTVKDLAFLRLIKNSSGVRASSYTEKLTNEKSYRFAVALNTVHDTEGLTQIWVPCVLQRIEPASKWASWNIKTADYMWLLSGSNIRQENDVVTYEVVLFFSFSFLNVARVQVIILILLIPGAPEDKSDMSKHHHVSSRSVLICLRYKSQWKKAVTYFYLHQGDYVLAGWFVHRITQKLPSRFPWRLKMSLGIIYHP